jgi:sec-independent protein translocase protein TatA
MGSMSLWHWIVVLLIVVIFFGTGKLANMGSDIGKAVKGFKDGMKSEDEARPSTPHQQVAADKSTVDVDAKEKTRT